ncbi:MAG: recombination protein O N-terminal domain-containing protein [Candidatus Pacebacteria bacterium]|nr:recombination protein O N-terminal domain-containing protein [Candidatus Paceibacterota bacterium]
MYQKYTTDAIVLGTRERGEADKTIILLTKDFGLLFARAIGARKESSLMRYALVTGSASRISLVRGKREWRVAGASSVSSGLPPASLHVFARMSRLISRLVHGEEESEHLFETVRAAHEALLCAEAKALPSIELLAVARVLHSLGYIAPEAVGSALFVQTAYTPEMAAETEKARIALLGAVNAAIAASQL